MADARAPADRSGSALGSVGAPRAPAHRSRRSRGRSAASCSCCSSAASIRRSFLSPEYLLQQLKVASFLGVIATGMMIVILLGPDRPVGAVGRRRRRDDGDRGHRLGSARRGAGDSGGRRLRRRARARQRRRRRVPAHPVDGRHARGERGRAGTDGRAHRRLLAAGLVVAGDALPRHRRHACSAFRMRCWCGRRSASPPSSC